MMSTDERSKRSNHRFGMTRSSMYRNSTQKYDFSCLRMMLIFPAFSVNLCLAGTRPVSVSRQQGRADINNIDMGSSTALMVVNLYGW